MHVKVVAVHWFIAVHCEITTRRVHRVHPDLQQSTHITQSHNRYINFRQYLISDVCDNFLRNIATYASFPGQISRFHYVPFRSIQYNVCCQWLKYYKTTYVIIKSLFPMCCQNQIIHSQEGCQPMSRWINISKALLETVWVVFQKADKLLVKCDKLLKIVKKFMTKWL